MGPKESEPPLLTWVFEGPRVFPLDLAMLGSKIIKKALQNLPRNTPRQKTCAPRSCRYLLSLVLLTICKNYYLLESFVKLGSEIHIENKSDNRNHVLTRGERHFSGRQPTV